MPFKKAGVSPTTVSLLLVAADALFAILPFTASPVEAPRITPAHILFGLLQAEDVFARAIRPRFATILFQDAAILLLVAAQTEHSEVVTMRIIPAPLAGPSNAKLPFVPAVRINLAFRISRTRYAFGTHLRLFQLFVAVSEDRATKTGALTALTAVLGSATVRDVGAMPEATIALAAGVFPIAVFIMTTGNAPSLHAKPVASRTTLVRFTRPFGA